MFALSMSWTVVILTLERSLRLMNVMDWYRWLLTASYATVLTSTNG